MARVAVVQPPDDEIPQQSNHTHHVAQDEHSRASPQSMPNLPIRQPVQVLQQSPATRSFFGQSIAQALQTNELQ